MAPLAMPLPELPVDGGFTEDQWLTLMSIMDTIAPSIRRESKSTRVTSELIIPDVKYTAAVDRLKKTSASAPDMEVLNEYLAEKPSRNPVFQNLLKHSLLVYTPADAKKGLSFILSALK
jgi:hypothetical protein